MEECEFSAYRPWQCSGRRSHPSVAIIDVSLIHLVTNQGTYGNFENELLAVVLGLEGVQNSRELGTIELDYNLLVSDAIGPAGRCFSCCGY